MISSHYGQFGYFQGLGDIGDLGATKKRRRGKKSFRRQSQRQQRQQEQEQQQSQDSGAGGGSDEGYEEEEEGTTESAMSAEQLQALAQLMQGGKKRKHRRRRRKSSMNGVLGWLEGLGDAVTFGAFGRGGGRGGRGPGSRAYHYHLQQLAQQAQQQQQQSSDSSSSGSGSSSATDLEALLDKLLEKRGISGVLGDIFDGTLGVLGGALGAAWGTVARLAGWAGIDLGSWSYGGPFGLFSALRPAQSSAWALPSPYAGLGHSEVEQAAIEQRRRGLAAFLRNAFAEMGGGDPRVGQRRLAEAGANYGPDAVIAIQEYLAARGQSPAALQRRLRVLRLEYGRARQQGNMAEANRLYYRINAIESRLGRYGGGPGGPMDTRVGLSIDSDVSVGTSGIPWKPILIGVGVVTLVSVVANSNKRRGGHKAGEAT